MILDPAGRTGLNPIDERNNVILGYMTNRYDDTEDIGRKFQIRRLDEIKRISRNEKALEEWAGGYYERGFEILEEKPKNVTGIREGTYNNFRGNHKFLMFSHLRECGQEQLTAVMKDGKSFHSTIKRGYSLAYQNLMEKVRKYLSK